MVRKMPIHRGKIILILAAIQLAMFSSAVQALDWSQAIDAVSEKSDSYWRLAEARGLESRFLGTGLNELHVVEHKCSILGRMLERINYITPVELSTEFDVDNADDQTTAIAAHSLDNWVYQAKRILDLDRERRVKEWNLDCVGQLGIPLEAFVGEVSRQTFFDIEGKTLRVLGDVGKDFSAALLEAINSSPEIEEIALGSGGGSVYEAIKAGQTIRRLGLETTLWNNCYSACTIVFMGGVNRRIWSPYPELSFHRVSIRGEAVDDYDPVYSHIAKYVYEMGGDGGRFVDFMLMASPSTFHSPHPDDLCNASLATWIQRQCI